jgi:hypothetical protein
LIFPPHAPPSGRAENSPCRVCCRCLCPHRRLDGIICGDTDNGKDIEQIFPTLVEASSHPGEEGAGGNPAPISYKSVNYIGLIPILTKAIQEQQTVIQDLKSEIELLRKEFLTLKASLGK